MNRAGMVPGGPEHVSAKNLLRRGLSRVLRQTGAPEQGVQVLLGETFAREYFDVHSATISQPSRGNFADGTTSRDLRHPLAIP
jgi:hypothetical protein